MKENISGLIDRYMAVSFYMHKMGELLIKEKICDVLTNEQYYTLRFLEQHGPCTSTELSEAFYVNKSAVTSNINRLDFKGLIKRKRAEDDRRLVYLSLSEKGIKLYDETEKRIHLLVEKVMENFEEEEIARFLDTYERFSEILIQMKNGHAQEAEE